MSKSDTLRPSVGITTSPPTSTGSRTPTTSVPIPSSSRLRQPVPPSPLSRIQGEPASPSNQVPATPPSQLSPPGYGNNIPQTSPCFIHSHLDRHGSLQGWLQTKGSGPPPAGSSSAPNSSHAPHRNTHLHNGPTPVRATPTPSRQPHHSHSHHQHSPHLPRPRVQSPNQSPVGSKTTSPIMNGSGSNGEKSSGGYDSDRSSQVGGSAILDGDLAEDDEEGGSLTKQLAETAQGVREMSKELGTCNALSLSWSLS